VQAPFVSRGTALPCPYSRHLSLVPAGEVRRGAPPQNPFFSPFPALLGLRANTFRREKAGKRRGQRISWRGPHPASPAERGRGPSRSPHSQESFCMTNHACTRTLLPHSSGLTKIKLLLLAYAAMPLPIVYLLKIQKMADYSLTKYGTGFYTFRIDPGPRPHSHQGAGRSTFRGFPHSLLVGENGGKGVRGEGARTNYKTPESNLTRH